MLTAEQFQKLRDIPPVIEFLANIENPRTKKAYTRDIKEFSQFVGIESSEDYRLVTRAHVIAWRESLKHPDRKPKPCKDATVRRKLAAISELFNFLCEKHSIETNPVASVKRPKAQLVEGSTPAISDEQMRLLLNAPDESTLKGLRDKAILITLAYHGLREAELCSLRVQDLSMRDGVVQFRVHGKGNKVRFIPAHPLAQQTIRRYLAEAGHEKELSGPLFRPLRNHSTVDGINKQLSPTAIYSMIVMHYAKKVGITDQTHGFCVHSLRVTAGTNSWEHGADIVDIQKMLGHSNISTTRGYLRTRKENLERSPSYKVQY